MENNAVINSIVFNIISKIKKNIHRSSKRIIMSESKVVCPECGSENVAQYRTMEGPMWCNDCKFRVDDKTKDNPFILDN